jgi:hypothetical protein
MFSVAAYKPYFDVDTSDVVERIWESVFPFRGTFTDKTSEKPDLYASTPFPTLHLGLGCSFVAVNIPAILDHSGPLLRCVEAQGYQR